jgi:hypothetical protein
MKKLTSPKVEREAVLAPRSGGAARTVGRGLKRRIRVPNIAALLEKHPYSETEGQAVIDSILCEAAL